jgi:hypothetical protein
VQYGAGAGVETHLAALSFAVAGVSDIALKATGLVVWLVTLGLVYATAARIGGAWAGWERRRCSTASRRRAPSGA